MSFSHIWSHDKNFKLRRKCANFFHAVHLDCGVQFSLFWRAERFFCKRPFPLTIPVNREGEGWVHLSYFSFSNSLQEQKTGCGLFWIMGMKSLVFWGDRPWCGQHMLLGKMCGPQSECYFFYFYIDLLFLSLPRNFYWEKHHRILKPPIGWLEYEVWRLSGPSGWL